MSMRSLVRCNVAMFLVLAMPAASMAPAWGATSPDGLISGRVYGNNGDPVGEATVRLRNLDSGRETASTLTRTDGAYSMESLPRAHYEIAVETSRGFYLVARSMEIGGDQSQSYIFRLNDATPEETRAALEAWAKDDDDKKIPPVDPTRSAASTTSFWINPLTVLLAGIAVVSATYLLVDEARSKDDSDRKLSPTGP
jgi:hypothetical protein